MASGRRGLSAEASPKSAKINVRMPDAASLEMLKLVLVYEAGVRGMTMGQACSELVMRAAHMEGYPPEVRERLAEIEAEGERRAVERSLRASRGG